MLRDHQHHFAAKASWLVADAAEHQLDRIGPLQQIGNINVDRIAGDFQRPIVQSDGIHLPGPTVNLQVNFRSVLQPSGLIESPTVQAGGSYRMLIRTDRLGNIDPADRIHTSGLLFPRMSKPNDVHDGAVTGPRESDQSRLGNLRNWWRFGELAGSQNRSCRQRIAWWFHHR